MKKFLLLSLVFCLSLLATSALAKNNQIVAGAGPSTQTAKAFFATFSKLQVCADYNFTVMEASVKHKGGIQNAGKFLFGRTGRPLSAKESASGREEIFLAKVPITFAKGLEVKVSVLSLAQIKAIFSRKIQNWKEVGGPDAPILLVGREPTEALFKVLKEDHPAFEATRFDKIFKKDHEVVTFLKSPLGRHAIAFGAKPNFSVHNLLAVKGFSSGVKLGLVYDVKNRQHPIIQAAKEFARGDMWINQLAGLEMLPAN